MFVKSQNRWFNTFFENGGDPNVGSVEPPVPPSSGTPRSYTEDEFKLAIENEKKARKEETTKLVSDLEAIKRSKGLSDQERQSLEERITTLNNSLMSKEELAKQERVRLERSAKETEETLSKERDTWKNRFQSTLIERAISDAASSAQAYDPSVFISLHRGNTFLEEVTNENGQVIDFAVKTKITKSENGALKELVMTPQELVKYMKEQPDQYGYLFKGENRGGLGGGNSQKPLADQDFKNMSPEQYSKIRKQLLEG